MKATDWVNNDHTSGSTYAQWNGVDRPFGEIGDKITFGKWFAPYNNHSFWTYKDGDGNEKVKPPGVSRVPMQNDD